MCQRCLRGSSSNLRGTHSCQTGGQKAIRSNQYGARNVASGPSTAEVILCCSGPPSGQTCVYQRRADHFPAVYLEKGASVPATKRGSLCSHSSSSQLWQSEHWQMRGGGSGGLYIFNLVYIDVRINSGLFTILVDALDLTLGFYVAETQAVAVETQGSARTATLWQHCPCISPAQRQPFV